MKFPARVRKHAHELETLAKAKREKRNRLVREATTELIFTLVDLAKMVIRGDITLTPHQLSTVRRYKADFKKLVSKSTGVKGKRNVIQKGGFLPALLGPVLKLGVPLLGNLLGGVFGGQ